MPTSENSCRLGLQEAGLDKPLMAVEMPLVPILAAMQQDGLAANGDELAELE